MSQSETGTIAVSRRRSAELDRGTSLASNYGRPKGLSIPDDSLHDRNFIKFRYRYREFLRISGCRKEIQSWSIRECSTSLKVLELVGVNILANLKLVLKYCVNISTLTLSRIVWSVPKPERSRSCSPRKMYIILNVLTELKFAGTGGVTPHEEAVVDYFFRQVRCPKLSTLIFEESTPEESTTDVQSGLEEETGYKSFDAFMLSKFLLQNESTIKVLGVERMNIDLVGTDNTESFKHLRLNKLICNVGSPSAERILGIQRHLKFLDCSTNSSISEDNLKAFVWCIRTCSHSLREISFIQNIVGEDDGGKITQASNTTEEDVESEPAVYPRRNSSQDSHHHDIVHDFSAYRICRKLKSLTVICVADGATTTAAVDHPRGRIANMHKLPLSLSTLIIRFDKVQDPDLNQFAKRLHKLVHLKYLVFQGNPAYPFTIKLKWIQTLINLPNLLTFEFHNGDVEQAKAVKLFINSIPGLANKLRIRSGSCIFRQTQSSQK